MKKIKISVVFLGYNNLNNLVKSYRSILELSELVTELVIIDSSTDYSIKNFVDSIKEFKTKYHWENAQGIYHAMNVSLGIADLQNYAWYLNPGDELIDIDIFKNLISKMESSESIWGYAQAEKKLSGVNEIFPKEPLAPTFINIASGDLSISHQAMIVHVGTLKNIGGFDQKYSIAADLKVQICLAKYYTPGFVFKPLVSIDPNGISHNKIFQTFVETAKVRLETDGFPFFLSVRLACSYILSKANSKIVNKFWVR